MRGKAFPQGVHVVVVGITPAYAGKSDCRCEGGAVMGDHPRVCGEKLPGPIIMALGAGSPPRMRGKVADMRKAGINPRITPAYAGKSKHQRQ